jgi:hypothetical protein
MTIRIRSTTGVGTGICLAGATLLMLAAATPSLAGCEPFPRYAGCKRTTDQRDLIDIKASHPLAPFSARDSVVWKIPKLEATSVGELPDPMTTDYSICFYFLDDAEEFRLVHELTAPAGLGCGRPRCWTRNRRGGVGYNGGPIRPDGIASFRLNPGDDGKAQLSLVGRGANLEFPGAWRIYGGEAMVQVQAGASCWSALYLNFGSPPGIRTDSRYRMVGSTIR